MNAKATTTATAPEVTQCSLSELQLDTNNPRFGGRANVTTEVAVLDKIADEFGIDDVLSSIALNGYFASEPMVGVRTARNRVRIVEGNRRLAACLILAGDARAKNQGRRHRYYKELLKHPADRVPVLVYEEDQDQGALLPYLGVRHIVGSQPWDSYAKAAWVAQVLDHNDLTMREIRDMIGDTAGTVPRFLEGFYFVNQLTRTGHFNPQDSTKSGRGSNPEFPFSWVYTALGFRPIRDWLGLEDPQDRPIKSPLPKSKLENGRLLLDFMFGNRSEGKSPAVPDSRQIKELAICVGAPDRLHLLKKGKNVTEVVYLTRPQGERLTDALNNANDALSSAWDILGQASLKEKEARSMEPLAKKVHNRATQVHKKLQSLSGGEDDRDEV